MPHKMLLGWCLPVFLLLLAARSAFASEPYDNVAAPPGSYFTIYPYYYGASRLMDKDGKPTAADPDTARYQTSFKYSYYNKTVLPNTLALVALLPVGRMEMLGDRDTGLGDLALIGSYWLVDNPATNTWFGLRMQTIVPIGSYDQNSTANMGSNVWQFRPILFAAKRIGNIHVELTAKYSMYSKDEDTGVRRGNDVIGEGYAGYYLRPDLLLGAHLNATFGRDKTVGGATVPDSGVRIFQAGASLCKNFAGGFSALVEALSDFDVKNSTEGYTVQMRLSWKL